MSTPFDAESPTPSHENEQLATHSGSGTVTSTGSTPNNPSQDEPTQEDLAAKAAKRAKAEVIGRYVAMFLMPLLMVGMLVSGYLASMHSPKTHDMPVVVAGTSEVATQFADSLKDATGNALDVSISTSPEDARHSVLNRESSAAVVIDGDQATLYTSSSAGASQKTTATTLIAPQILAAGLTMVSDDVAPLPANDMSGLGAMFLTTALLMAAYLPFSITLSNSPELLRLKRAVPLLAGWAALIAGLIALITGPILGVVEGHTLALMGVAWLGIFTIGSVQLFFTRIFGPMAVVVGMLLLMVFGIPASNMSLPIWSMPDFYGFLNKFLPAPALGESLRSVLYFNGHGIGKYLTVLIIGGILGLAATFTFDRIKLRKHGELKDGPVNVESLHGGPRPKTRRWRYISLVGFCVSMVAMMITVMLAAMGTPKPRDMPVVVVGSTVEQAEQLANGLEQAMPGYLDLSATDSVEEARELVTSREVVAAYVLPSQTAPTATLLTNQAAGTSAVQIAQSVFTQISAGQEFEMTTEDLAPLPEHDSMGMTTMYLAMGWIMAGFMIVVVGANAAPMSRPLRKMIPIVAGWAVFISAALYVIAGPIIGAVEGHFFELWGAGALTVFCVAWFAAIWERLFGMFAVPISVGILMFVGIPASNAAVSQYMVPGLFQWLHGVLPFPAAAEAIRSILYFGGDVVGENLLTLSLWGVISLAIVAAIDHFKPLNSALPHAATEVLGQDTIDSLSDDDKELVTV